MASIESKIHIMQDDLDEIERKEKLTLVPPPEVPKLAKKTPVVEEIKNKEVFPFSMPVPPPPIKESAEINQQPTTSDIKKPNEWKVQETEKIEKPEKQVFTPLQKTSPFFSAPKQKSYPKSDISKPELKTPVSQKPIQQNNTERQLPEIREIQKENIPPPNTFSEPIETKLQESLPLEQLEENQSPPFDQEPVLQRQEEFISTEEQPRHVLFSFASKVFELLIELLKIKIDKTKETKAEQEPREIISNRSDVREIRKSEPQTFSTSANLTPSPIIIPQPTQQSNLPPTPIQQPLPQYNDKEKNSSQEITAHSFNEPQKINEDKNKPNIYNLPQNFNQIGPEFPDKKFNETESDISSKNTQEKQLKEESVRTGTWPIQRKENIINQKSHSVDMGIKPRKKTFEKDALFSDNIILKKRWGWKKYLFISLFLSLLGSSIIFIQKTNPAFFEIFDKFISSSKKIPDITGNQSAENLLTKETQKENLPFSITKPNSFVVDVEKETVSTIQEKILNCAETMKNADMKVPVLFSVVDKTNTPIAFFIFASIFNIGLSPNLLNNLDDEFYLAIFIDNGDPRIALSIQTKNIEKTKSAFSLSEKSLPVSLKNLLLSENIPSIKNPVFANGSYRNIPLRFLNLSEDASISIDYVFMKNFVIISTSKEMTHAMINKLFD